MRAFDFFGKTKHFCGCLPIDFGVHFIGSVNLLALCALIYIVLSPDKHLSYDMFSIVLIYGFFYALLSYSYLQMLYKKDLESKELFADLYLLLCFMFRFISMCTFIRTVCFLFYEVYSGRHSLKDNLVVLLLSVFTIAGIFIWSYHSYAVVRRFSRQKQLPL